MTPATQHHYKCVCGNLHKWQNCFILNPDKRPATWIIKYNTVAIINKRLCSNPGWKATILALGYEFYNEDDAQGQAGASRFAYGGVALQHGGAALQPASPDNPQQHLADNLPPHNTSTANTSEQVPTMSTMEDNISSMTGDDQSDIHGADLSMDSNQPLSSPFIGPALPEFSLDPELQFERLPTEIITKIVAITYQLTLEDLPEFHPRIKEIYERHVYDDRDERKLILPTLSSATVLLNEQPPTCLVSQPGRRHWLSENAGKWGPQFQIMFMSKQIYEIAKLIRYKEVHLMTPRPFIRRPCVMRNLGDNVRDGYSLFPNSLCYEVACNKIVSECTRQVHLWCDIRLMQDCLQPLVEALATLPKLEHVCITIGIMRLSGPPLDPGDFDLLFFFRLLKLHSLTLIWTVSEETPFSRAMDAGSRVGNGYPITEETGPAPSYRERYMKEIRDVWMTCEYRRSPYYMNPKKGNTVITPGKAAVKEDWTTTGHPENYKQWPMDTFIFTPNPVVLPRWNLRKNPHNHPSQLNESELRACRPVLKWRKGFHPWTEEELDRIKRGGAGELERIKSGMPEGEDGCGEAEVVVEGCGGGDGGVGLSMEGL